MAGGLGSDSPAEHTQSLVLAPFHPKFRRVVPLDFRSGPFCSGPETPKSRAYEISGTGLFGPLVA
jgi:hypothetical protein